VTSKKIQARFIQPMLLLRTEKLPEGPDWLYELKYDGYRALAIKTGGTSSFTRGMITTSPRDIRRLHMPSLPSRATP